ncbi:MAG: hypothetical protein ACI31R_00495 [Bacilli bacterium]
MDKKPEIFKPEIGNVNNNKKAYYSFLEDRLDIKTDDYEENDDVISFMNKLAKSGSYIFNKDVVIVTKDKRYETRIAGKLGDRIVTLDNDSIRIDDIIKIYEKK